MRAFKQKKGMVEAYGLFLFFFFLILIGLTGYRVMSQLSAQKSSLKGISGLGDIEQAILEENRNAQKLSVYLDQSALYSFYQSYYELGQAGGNYPSDSSAEGGTVGDGCAGYYGYAVWAGSGSCMPKNHEDLSMPLEGIMQPIFASYLALQPELPQSGYSISLTSGKKAMLVGTNKEQIETALRSGAATLKSEEIQSEAKKSDVQRQAELGSGLFPEQGRYTFIESPNRNAVRTGKRDVDRLVLHYTAGKTLQSAVDTFSSTSSGVSAHYIIDKDGSVVQMVPENDIAWHAGCGRGNSNCIISGMNSPSIGIEIVNLGFDCSKYEDCRKTCLEKDGKCWEQYPEAQMDALVKLSAEIIQRHPGITVDTYHIMSHSDINAWKSDPGPAFDWEQYLAGLRQKSGAALVS